MSGYLSTVVFIVKLNTTVPTSGTFCLAVIIRKISMDGMGVGGMVLQSERLVQMRRYYTKKGAHSSPEI